MRKTAEILEEAGLEEEVSKRQKLEE